MNLKEAMMRKATTKNSFGRGWLVAASLAFTLAAFGCSSNQMYGNGQPTTVTPTMNSSDHAVTPGSSSGTAGNPPMASSYTYPSSASSDMYPANQVDVDTLAIQAARRGFRGVVLGPSGADGVQPGVTVTGGVYVSPALSTNPAQTINSSISSPGAGGAITGGPIVPTSASAGVTLSPTGATVAAIGTGATLGTATTGALTTSTGGPIVAGSSAFSPVLMNSTPAPQATGTANPTLSTVVAAGSALTNGTAPTARTTNTTSATAANTTAKTSALHTATVNVAGISVQTGANGGVMVSNVGSPAVTSSAIASPTGSTTSHH